MNIVQKVDPSHIHQIWNQVESYLEASIETSTGECTLDQLKGLLVLGTQTLLVAVKEDKIIGAMTIEFINYPNERVMFITALGGRGVVDSETFTQVEEWAKSQGATKVNAWAKKGQAKLYEIKAGFNTVRFVMEKKL